MKTVKMILFFISLGLVLYLNYFFISVNYGTSPSLTWAYFYNSLALGISSILFILCDVWLHHRKIRLIALGVLALAYVMSFEYYLFCQEYGLIIYLYTEKIILPSTHDFSIYWISQGLSAVYLLAAIGVSHLIRRKKLYTKQNDSKCSSLISHYCKE